MSYQPKLSSNIVGNNFFFELKPIKAWRAILGMALAVSISLLIGGSIAIVTFPLSSIAVGYLLYRRYPLLYCSFIWWMWFISPLIRRIIDLRCGYLTPGPWTLTPLLVTSISILTLLKYSPKAHKQSGLPFVIAAACCLYGYLISLVKDGFSDQGILVLLGWLAPICFGFYLFINWRDYPSYRQNFQRTFLWGVLFMGIYGIVQYVLAPPWDRFWIEQIGMTGTLSFGIPEPFGIRVSSSVGSPQDFAATMTAGLILLFCIQGSQQLLAAGFGYLSFLLSLARSAWLSWLVSTLVFFRALKSNLQIRMIISITVTAAIILPVTTIEPFSTVIGERIETLSSNSDDVSYRARQEGFNTLIDYAMVEFIGLGIRNPLIPDVDTKRDYVIGDNGVLLILFALGWIGTLPYILSMLILIIQIRQMCLRNSDLFLQAAYAIVLGLVSQIFFKVITDGNMAIILWGFIGIGMSACNYYSSQKN